MAKMINVSCPACKTINTMEKDFIFWKNNTCANCHAKLRASDAVGSDKQIVVCNSCGSSVAWDPAKGDECPICRNSLTRQMSERAIACPGCGVGVRYMENSSDDVTCPNCGKVFNPIAQRSKIASLMTSSATDIQMPPDALKEGEIVWHHPTHQFPVNARVVTAPGMLAVLVQGVTVVAVAEGQSIRLSETGLKSDAWSYDGAAEKMVNVDVYYLKLKFNATFNMGGSVTLQMPYDRAATVPYYTTCMISQVTDPAAFLRWVNYNRDGDVVETEFGMKEKDGGKKIARYSRMLREDVVLKTVAPAMQKVCGLYGIQPDQLPQYAPQVMQQIEELANERLADIGLSVTVSPNGSISEVEVQTRVDPLKQSLVGMQTWETSPFTVHISGNVMATATLKITGSMRTTINDENALNLSPDAYTWRSNAEAARADIRAYVHNALTSRFTAIVQQIIEEQRPALHMLPMFNGFMIGQASLLLNQQNEFFHRHGLFVSDLTLDISIVNKSELFELHEKNAVLPDTLALKEKIRDMERDFATREYAKDAHDKTVRMGVDADETITQTGIGTRVDTAMTDAEIAKLENAERLRRLKMQFGQAKVLDDLANQHQIDETIRRYSFEAWRDQQQIADQQMAAEMNRARMQQQHSQAMQKSEAVHEADLERLAQDVGMSQLSFREKMEAYARIQRNLAFQDQLDQNNAVSRAGADNEVYAARLAMKLNEDSRRAMETLDYEQKLHEEDLQKARFAREMELRRQEVAEEMSRLQAEFESKRALAAEEEQRRKSESEVVTLKLMLEYLAKDGEHQVTAARMQAAREQAERSWQLQHADIERQAALARQQAQQASEQKMADRAYELVQQMNGMQHELEMMKLDNERAYNQGRAMVDASAQKYQQNQMDVLKAQMESLQAAVKTIGAQVGNASAPANGLGKWITGAVDQVRNAFTGTAPAPQTQTSYSGAYQTGYAGVPQGSYGSAYQPGYTAPAGGYQPATSYSQPTTGYSQPAGSYGVQPGTQGMNVCRNCGTQYAIGLGCCPKCRMR